MKRLILNLFIVLCSFEILGQKELIFTDVVKLDSIKKNEIYNRAKIWIAKAYVDSKEVLQVDSKEDGQIIGKALIKYNQSFLSGSATTNGFIKYTISIFVKDGRYKYEISSFIHEPNGTNKISLGIITDSDEYNGDRAPMTTKNWYNKVWIDIKKRIDEEISLLVSDMKNSMSQKLEISSDDW